MIQKAAHTTQTNEWSPLDRGLLRVEDKAENPPPNILVVQQAQHKGRKGPRKASKNNSSHSSLPPPGNWSYRSQHPPCQRITQPEEWKMLYLMVYIGTVLSRLSHSFH